jgi:septal ring factor EnvC (AmiA/AmiB activator)
MRKTKHFINCNIFYFRPGCSSHDQPEQAIVLGPLEKAENRASMFQRKLKTVRCAKRKLEASVDSLKSEMKSLVSVITELQTELKLSNEALAVLSNCASAVPKELLLRTAKKMKYEGKLLEEFHPAIREFAMTLHLYSAKAYR